YGPDGMWFWCYNFHPGEPIRRLVVNVREDLEGAVVESVHHGRLKPAGAPDGWSVALPLGITDCITIRRPA
ncbi:MAG: hypothetical protein ACE5JM_15205, partial [Armatimonadota bacterium]